MRIPLRAASLAAVLVFVSATADAASRWKKAYYRATVPGAFARTESVNAVNGDVIEYASTRLVDEDGKVVLETRYEMKNGRFAGTKGVNRYVLREGFPFAAEGPAWMRGIVEGRASGPDGAVFEMDESTVGAIASGATDYGAIVVFKGTETVAGKVCDRYAYTSGAGDQKVEGEYWMNDTVPFGVVKEVLSGKDATGALYRFETKLVESGVDPAIAKAAKAPRVSKPVATLGALYAAGKISLLVEVEAGSAVASVTVTNAGETPLDLVVPKGPTKLACGEPVGELVLAAEKERKLSIPPGEAAATLELAMSGARRPASGSFTVSIHEGRPLFSGSVEMGPSRQ